MATKTNEDLVALALAAGWTIISSMSLQGLPLFGRGERRMWRHPSGVTCADLEGDGNQLKYANRAYYPDIETAVREERPTQDAEIIDEPPPAQGTLGILEDL